MNALEALKLALPYVDKVAETMPATVTTKSIARKRQAVEDAAAIRETIKQLEAA